MDWRTIWSRRTWSLKEWDCQSCSRWTTLTFWVSASLDRGQNSQKYWFSVSFIKRSLGKTIWHMLTKCVALAIRCSKWWNPMNFQLVFNLLIPPWSVSFNLPGFYVQCLLVYSSERLALLWHLSDDLVFKIWTLHWTENSRSTEWEICVFCIWYETQSLHIVF